MSLDSHDTNTAGSDTKKTLSYAADASKLHVEEKKYSYSTKDGHDAEKIGFGEATQESVHQPKRTAKIHDFCLGIPFDDHGLQGSDGGLKLYCGIAADGSVVITDDLQVAHMIGVQI
ncbi:hypothetical protein JHK85_027108 [Glycine max]|nr:hypothetical protein JHK85_027108 [Glycine max]KAG5002476.1 hypothetical protein JHK86_026615 [Glycine max]